VKKAGIVFLIFIILITVSLKIEDLTSAVNKTDEENILIEINKGASAQQIVDILYMHGLIKSRLIFRAYIHLTETDQKLQAGYYYLNRSMDMFDIIDQLKKGGNAVYKVTIPEGFTVQQVIERLAEKSKNNLEAYTEVLEDHRFEYTFIPEESDRLLYKLEGYLYPNTYTIPLGFNAAETIYVILHSFKNNVKTKIEESELNNKYDLNQILTIASLIEREAKFDDEKPIIASVIYNRLNQDMKLQIDATVQYVLGESKERLLYEDLEVESLYNTYLHKGLPPGPICNPGQASIEAALNPSETDFLFYFAENNGRHIFTESYEEHIRKQREIKNEGSSDG